MSGPVSRWFKRFNFRRPFLRTGPPGVTLQLVLVAIAYIASAKLGLSLMFEGQSSTAFWPATGVSVAAYVIFGARAWPAIFAGAITAFVPHFGADNLPAALAVSILAAAAPYVASRCLRRSGFDYSLQRTRDVAVLAICGAVAPMAVSATVGIVVLHFAGFGTLKDPLGAWCTWWVGDVLGVIVVSPVLFAWKANIQRDYNLVHALEVAAAFLSLVLIDLLSKGSGPIALLAYTPIILWCALRLSQRENATIILLISIVAAVRTMETSGSVIGGVNDGLVLLDVFIATIALTTLTGGAAIAQRRRLESMRLKASTDRLVESETRFRNAFESAAIGMGIVSLEGRWLQVNSALCRMLGYTPDELRASDFQSITHPDDLERDVAQFTAMIEGKSNDYCIEKRYFHKNGGVIWTVLSSSIVRSADGGPLHFVSQVQDISARRLADLRMRSIIEASPTPTAISDAQRNIVYINQAFRRTFGYELDDITTLDQWRPKLFPNPADFEKFENGRIEHTSDIESGRIAPLMEVPIAAKDGRVRQTVTAMAYVPDSQQRERIIALQDITELRAAHDRLREAQKMEAFGRLASGIAHDFNNLLGVVRASAELLEHQQARLQDTESSVRLIMRACERGADLTRRLLIFSRKSNSRPADVSVTQTMDDLVAVLRRTLGSHIAIDLHLEGGDTFVFVDATLFNTALYNLAINARDAMPDGGTLTFRVARHPARPGRIAENGEVEISITDSGEGMRPEVMTQAFEPFFTTKDPGKGTGLGLSMVYGFVEEARGDIRVDSALGKGTTFTIHLPISSTRTLEAEKNADVEKTAGAFKVLLVEDDDDLREATTIQLRTMGHFVKAAASTREALALVEEARDFDVLVTDFRLGEALNGDALAREVQSRLPKISTIVMSGYLHPEEARALDPHWVLLEKPATKDDLNRALRRP